MYDSKTNTFLTPPFRYLKKDVHTGIDGQIKNLFYKNPIPDLQYRILEF